MNSKMPIAIAFLGCFLLGGCAHIGVSSESHIKSLESFLPLSVGNEWVYSTSFQGQPQADLTVSIVKEEDGYFYDDRPSPSRLRFDRQGLRDGEIRYLLKLPVAKGQKWMSVADVKTVERYQIEAVGQDVTVPAGTFRDCVIVRLEVRLDAQRTMQNHMVFAPNVGIIEISTALQTGTDLHEQSRLKLKNYHLVTSGH